MNDYLLITRCLPRRPHTSPPSRVLSLDPGFFAKPSILRPTAIIPRFPKPLVGSSSLQRLHCSPLSIARLMSSAAHKSPPGREQGGKRRKPTEIEVFDSSPPEESLHIFFKKKSYCCWENFSRGWIFMEHIWQSGKTMSISHELTSLCLLVYPLWLLQKNEGETEN